MQNQLKKLVVHGPLDMTGRTVEDVASAIDLAVYPQNAEIEFGLPVAFGVQQVGQALLNNYPASWVDRPRRHNGPIRKYSRNSDDMFVDIFTALSYDLQRNRITISKTLTVTIIDAE